MSRPDLCLDFANTRYYRGQATPTETLNVPADLAAWAKATKPPSARELATALARLDRVRRCANPECGWLFLDDSRAGKRRWCSMSACGNRAKARRHYHKSKGEDA